MVIDAARRGEGWAFDVLFDQHVQRITAFMHGRRAPDPDDLVNEVFIGAFRGIRGFRGDERAFRAWLFRIARNKIIDAARRSDRRPSLRLVGDTVDLVERERDARSLTDRSSGQASTEDEVVRRLGLERVWFLLDQVTGEQRDVLLLRIIGDLTIEQIALVLDKPQGAVKALQRRGLRRLERFLNDHDGVPASGRAEGAGPR